MRNLNDISVQYLKGVGPSRKKLFEQLGVNTIEDLLYFFPRRYEDRRQMTVLSKLKIGETYTVSGRVLTESGRQAWFTKKHVSQITIEDDTGSLTAVWFNQPYIGQYFKAGEMAILYGKVEQYKDRLQMVSPEYEILGDEEDEALSVGRIVPIYPLTRGITQRYLRKAVKLCLDEYAPQLKEAIPYNIRTKYNLHNLVKSIVNLHFPEDLELQKESFRRVSFEEFFLFQISVLLRKASIVRQKGTSHKIDDAFTGKFLGSFSFGLTDAQKKVIGEISRDMQSPSPMHRLLQGDVGSGKTLVAFFGCVAAKHNNCQSAILAPTEILARQHYDVLTQLKNTALFKDIRIAFLASSLNKKEKEKLQNDIREGRIDLAIGTHALLEESVQFKRLSYVVIDEQHKFGVRQRALLPSKGVSPDVLIMTATPIPRTLCLTLYGDLDVSVIDEMPQGRGKTRTLVFEQESEKEVYQMVRDAVKAGEQAYIVYPIIDESEKLDLKAAEKMFKHFKEKEFKDFNVGILHGKIGKEDAQSVMDDFKNKRVDILVSTIILEVGVDVPNANIMVIEHAERFGLAQLHQLRGRIGRGSRNATCILLAKPTTPDSKARLDAIALSHDGFKIAEQDLMIRGPGEFFGRHQHGINELKIANPATQLDVLEMARKEAVALVESDSKLQNDSNAIIRSVIEKRYPTYLAMARAG